jgi:Flp pilus assembly protein TadB
MLFAINFVSPDYMKPMYHGIGLLVLMGTAAMVSMGSFIIFRMTKIEV